MTNSFKLKTREEVELFEARLNEYMISMNCTPLTHISLVTAYEQLQEHKDKDSSRVFSALIDLHLNFMLLFTDLNKIAATWNRFFSIGQLEGGSTLDSTDKFFGKMEIHRYSTSFVLRYRALWDKIMGFLILLFKQEQYDKFFEGNSRKKKFDKIASRIEEIPNELVTQIHVFLTLFDDSFRTPEAHQAGVLRKYTFLMEPMLENPQIELLGYWNFINEMVVQLGDCLKNIKSPELDSIKLIKLGNYISMETPKIIQKYVENLKEKGELRDSSILAATLLTCDYLNKLQPNNSLNILTLKANFESVLIQTLPDFFNEKFWLSNAKLILNYCKSWELDPEIILELQPVLLSHRGTMQPEQLNTKDEVKDFMILIAAGIAAKEICQKLNVANSSAEELKRLLFPPNGGASFRIILPDSPSSLSDTSQSS